MPLAPTAKSHMYLSLPVGQCCSTELSAMIWMGMFQIYVTQYSNHMPHVTTEAMKCGYGDWEKEFYILVHLH